MFQCKEAVFNKVKGEKTPNFWDGMAFFLTLKLAAKNSVSGFFIDFLHGFA